MELRGIISDGRIVVDGGVDLPEGTRVSLSIRRSTTPAPSRARVAKTTKRKPDSENPLLRLATLGVRTGRSDLADRHDEIIDGVFPPAKPTAKRRARKPRP